VSVDYVSELQICLHGMHRCNLDASKVKYEYGPQLAQAGFRCRVVLTFGKPGDGEYAWSEVRGSKKDAKQDAARLALESLPGMKEGQSPGQGSAGGPTSALVGADGREADMGGGGQITHLLRGLNPMPAYSAQQCQSPAATWGAVLTPTGGTVGARGSEMAAWLLKIGIAEDDIGSVMDSFSKPEYGVKSVQELLALEEQDIDEILEHLPLGKRRLLKKGIKEKKV